MQPIFAPPNVPVFPPFRFFYAIQLLTRTKEK